MTRRLTLVEFTKLVCTKNRGDPTLHREVAWLAANEKRAGAVVLDLYGKDYGWVLLEDDGDGQFRCVDVATSLPSAEEAEAALAQRLAEE